MHAKALQNLALCCITSRCAMRGGRQEEPSPAGTRARHKASRSSTKAQAMLMQQYCQMFQFKNESHHVPEAKHEALGGMRRVQAMRNTAEYCTAGHGLIMRRRMWAGPQAWRL